MTATMQNRPTLAAETLRSALVRLRRLELRMDLGAVRGREQIYRELDGVVDVLEEAAAPDPVGVAS